MYDDVLVSLRGSLYAKGCNQEPASVPKDVFTSLHIDRCAHSKLLEVPEKAAFKKKLSGIA